MSVFFLDFCYKDLRIFFDLLCVLFRDFSAIAGLVLSTYFR